MSFSKRKLSEKEKWDMVSGKFTPPPKKNNNKWIYYIIIIASILMLLYGF